MPDLATISEVNVRRHRSRSVDRPRRRALGALMTAIVLGGSTIAPIRASAQDSTQPVDPKWGNALMTASPRVVQPGGVITFTLVGESFNSRAGLLGGVGWGRTIAGTVVSGCTNFDMTCAFRVGTARPRTWSWTLAAASLPNNYFQRTEGCDTTPEYSCASFVTTYGWSHWAIAPLTDPTPTASFTVSRPTATPAGTYLFTSTTQPVDGIIPTLSWDFGDGGAGNSSPSVERQFTRPATYNVKLKACISTRCNTATTAVVVDPPKLSVTIDGTEQLKKKSSVVTLVVAADGGVGDLTDVRATGSMLRADPTDALEITQPTGPSAAPFSLANGTSKRIDVKVKGLKDGPFSFKSNWRATSAGGEVTGVLSKDSAITTDELEVTATFSDNDFVLDEDAKGVTPKIVTVTVKVKNVLSVPIDGVTVDPKPTLKTRSGKPLVTFPIDVTQQALPSDDLGTLLAAETKTVTYKLNVTDDIEAFVRVFAIGTVRNGGRGDGTVEADFTAKPKYDVYFEVEPDEARFRGPNPALTAGENFGVAIKVGNRTAEKKVFLLPLAPNLRGVGLASGGGKPVDLSKFSADDPDAPPFGGELEPNRTVPELLRAIVSTLPIDLQAKGFFTLSYRPRAMVVNEEDGTFKAIAPERILIKEGSGPYEVKVNPPTVVNDYGYGALAFGMTDGFIRRSVDIFISLGSGAFHLAQWLALKAPELSQDGLMPSRIVLRNAEALNAFWKSLSPIERQDFTGSVIVAMERQYGEPVVKAKAAIDASVTDWFVKQDKAIESGDVETVGRMHMEIVAELTTGEAGIEAVMKSTAIALTRARMFRREILVARAAAADSKQQARAAEIVSRMDLEEAQRLSAAESSAAANGGVTRLRPDEAALARLSEKEAKLLDNGQALTPQLEAKIFGVAPGVSKGMADLAEKYGVVITVRPNGSFRYKWLLEGAGLKVEAFKMKTVNKLDSLFLGYRESDLGSLVLRSPLDPSDLAAVVREARIQYGDLVADAVLKRGQQRAKEWKNYAEVYKQYAKPLSEGGGVPVGFNRQGNALVGPSEQALAKLDLRPVTGGRPRGVIVDASKVEYYELHMQPVTKLFNGVSIGETLARITGDIDILDMRLANGMALPTNLRMRLYGELDNLSGMLHGESSTWMFFDDGTPSTGTQRSIFADYEAKTGAQNEALMQIGPDRVSRSVRVNMKATVLGRADQHYVHYVGGYTNWLGEPPVPAGLAIPPTPDLGPALQLKSSKKGSKTASVDTANGAQPGDTLVVNPGRADQETVTVAAVGSAGALASSRALSSDGTVRFGPRLATEVEEPTDSLTITLAAPFAFDHSVGSIWVPTSQIAAPPTTTTTVVPTTVVPTTVVPASSNAVQVAPSEVASTAPSTLTTPPPTSVPSTTTPAPATTLTTVVADPPLANATTLPSAAPAVAAVEAVEAGDAATPAFTGSNDSSLALSALMLLAVGGLLVYLGRLRQDGEGNAQRTR